MTSPTWICTNCRLHFWAILMKVSHAISLKILFLEVKKYITLIFKKTFSFYLNTFMCFVHKFKQFIDDSFKEPPMSTKKTRVLADDVHDV